MQPVAERREPNGRQLRPSFRDRIAWAEHSDIGGGPQRVGYQDIHTDNRGNRVVGRYQFGRDLLQDMGVLSSDGNWTGPLARQLGIRNEHDFLNSPAAQDATFEEFVRFAQRRVEALRLDRFVGRSIDGIQGRIVVTLPGLVAAIHRTGAPAVSAYLAEVDGNRWSSRNLPSRRNEWLRRRNDAIETRLRVFEREQLSMD